MFILLLHTYYSMDREWEVSPIASSMEETKLEEFKSTYPLRENQKFSIKKVLFL